MFDPSGSHTTEQERAILRKLRVWIAALGVACLIAGIGIGAMLSGQPTVAQSDLQIARAPEALSASLGEIARGVERHDALRRLFLVISGVMPVEQGDLVPARHEKIRQLRAEFAGGKIREPPHFIERLECRPGCDNAMHESEIAGKPRAGKQEKYSPSKRTRLR